MTLLNRACASPYMSISLKLCMYVVLRYSASKNGVTLKLAVAVVQGHWKWRRSIDHIQLFISPPLYIYIALFGTVFALLDVEKYRDSEIWVRGH